MAKAKPKKEKTVTGSDIKDCCPLMTLVLSRAKESDKIGMMREVAFNFKTGTTYSTIF